MTEWIDTTSYQRDEKGKVPPRSWTLRTGQVRDYDRGAIHVQIHHMHGIPDAWFVSSNDLGIERRDLQTTDVDVAKASAIGVVRTKLLTLTSALELAAPSPKARRVRGA